MLVVVVVYIRPILQICATCIYVPVATAADDDDDDGESVTVVF